MKNNTLMTPLKTSALARVLGFAGILVGLGGLVACSSSPTPNYYTLTPKVAPLTTTKLRVIEVMPVGLPDRLRRAPIVVQDIQGKSQLLDQERWSSNLDAELRDGLSAGLQQKLGAVDRYISGMSAGQRSYRIATDFSRFDIEQQAKSQLSYSAQPFSIEVVVAWMVKSDDSQVKSPSTSSTLVVRQPTQLSCRMSFSQPVLNQSKQMPDIADSARLSLSRVVDAVAASVLAVESNQLVKIADGVCS